LVIPLHALAVLAVIGGLYRTDVLPTYLLWAILFEMGALNANLCGK
jgi:hypothetical protein